MVYNVFEYEGFMNDIPLDNSENRQLKAIMFTDIKGFTSLMESDEKTAVELIKTQRNIVRKNVAKHGGEERETIGDAFLVIFDSAINAVKCAVDVQTDIWEFNQKREKEKQVWIRIGIHLGDIIVESGSIFGEGVNLAARVEPLAEAGGVCITQQVYDQVRHHITINVKKLSVHELKNVTDVPKLYHIVLPTTAPKGPLTMREHICSFLSKPSNAIIITIIFLLVSSGLVYYLYFAKHTVFAKHVAKSYHVPVPRYEIKKENINKLNHYYELNYEGRRLKKLTEVRKPQLSINELLKACDFEFTKKQTKNDPFKTFEYDGNTLKEESVKDNHKQFQHKIVYTSNGRFGNIEDQAGYTLTMENQISNYLYTLNHDGQLVAKETRNAFGITRDDYTGVAMYHYEYNALALPAVVKFFDSHGNIVENKDGVAQVNYSYDKDGFIDRIIFKDRYGSITESLSGIAIIFKRIR